MTITKVNTETFLADATIFIRDQLLANVTDPISGTRPGDSKFCTTSFPERKAVYPFIVVRVTNFPVAQRLGVGSEMHEMEIVYEIRVWARNVKEREEISQEALNHLRDIEHATGGTIDAELHDFTPLNSFPVDEVKEDGRGGKRSRVMTVQYSFIFGAT